MFTFDNISLDRILVPVDGSNQSKEALRRSSHGSLTHPSLSFP